MKITVELNQKSIQEATKQLLYVKKILPTLTRDFLQDVAMWLINRANMHLNNSDIGENVKTDIRNGWTYNFTASGIKISNSADKAVFVEFGVGVVGQSESHPRASAEGYEYNVDTSAKQDDGSWHFFTDEANLDLPKSAINWGTYGKGVDNRLSVYTKGAKGVWYAYNAIVDAQMELTMTGGGEIGALWEKAKRKYIK